MEEIDVFKSMRESVDGSLVAEVDEREAARLKLIAEHKAWLKKIKKEHPSPYQFFKVGVYIRYRNRAWNSCLQVQNDRYVQDRCYR